MKRFWYVAAALVFLLVVYLGIKWWNRDVVAVKTAAITPGSIEEIVSASGVVDAPVYNLGSKMGGRILVWRVKEGARVEKGELLAEFDNYEQARNDYERARKLYKEGVASRQALDLAKTAFESSRIVSPQGGMVASLNYEEGETVVPGYSAVDVVNYDRSWVEAQIDEIDIGEVKVGDKVKITSDVYPDKIYEGKIYWIAPVAELRKVGGRVKLDEESYVFPCKVSFLGEHNELKVNMSVNVDILTKRKENALVVPREALVSKDDASMVFLVRKGKVYQQKVEIGLRSYGSVEALSGVKEGEILAVSNLSKLKDRGRIKIER